MNAQPFEIAVHNATTSTSELAFPLAQVATGAFAITASFLAKAALAPTELAAIALGGAALVVAAWSAFGRLQGLSYLRNDRELRRSAASARNGFFAFVSLVPVSLATMLVHYWSPGPVIALAIITVLSMYAATAYVRLRAVSGGLASLSDAWEGRLALGFTALGIVWTVAWLLTRIDEAVGYGPLPTTLASDWATVVSYAAVIAVVLIAALAAGLPRAMRPLPEWTVRVAMSALCVPVALVLLIPLHSPGEPGLAFVPDYLCTVPSHALGAAVLGVCLVHLIRPAHNRG